MSSKPSRHRFSLKEWPTRASEIQAYMDPTFADIAGRYDLMTRIMSFGLEQGWKKKAIGLILKEREQGRILDLATGTGDFPLYLRNAGLQSPIIGLDRNPRMLAYSVRKCAAETKINFVRGDLMQIPFKDRSFNAITMGYGLRYVVDICHGFDEIFRLLRRGGIFVCLEFGIPRNPFYRGLCLGYLLLFGTLMGIILHRGKADTYWHIVESLRAYPGQERVVRWLQKTGFNQVELREDLGGLITIISAIRP